MARFLLGLYTTVDHGFILMADKFLLFSLPLKCFDDYRLSLYVKLAKFYESVRSVYLTFMSVVVFGAC